jgi:transglutaminase-like putative cysteine protease
MRIAIEHITRYRYTHETSYSIQTLRLTPQSFAGQRVLDWQIFSRPAASLLPARDGFGNVVHSMTVFHPHSQIEITAAGTVDVEDRHGVVAGAVETVPQRVYLRRTELTEAGDRIVVLARDITDADRLTAMHTLMARIREQIDYRPGTTSALTTAEEALSVGSGVCQDHAHVFVAAARSLAIPARYVTGYLLLDAQGADAAHHAWAEAWIDGLGWVGFDVANRICPTDRYVRLAAGLDARYAAPIRGARRGGGLEVLEVAVSVAHEASQQ